MDKKHFELFFGALIRSAAKNELPNQIPIEQKDILWNIFKTEMQYIKGTKEVDWALGNSTSFRIKEYLEEIALLFNDYQSSFRESKLLELLGSLDEEEDQFVTLEEAAEYIGIGEKQVRNIIKKEKDIGGLRFSKKGLILMDDLLEYIKRRDKNLLPIVLKKLKLAKYDYSKFLMRNKELTIDEKKKYY